MATLGAISMSYRSLELSQLVDIDFSRDADSLICLHKPSDAYYH